MSFNRPLERFALAGGALVLIAGTLSTYLWLASRGPVLAEGQSLGPLLTGLLLTLLLTLINISLRWVRWHYLLRVAGAGLPAKLTAKVYLAFLPAILTPFYLGELLRAAVLTRLVDRAWSRISRIWLVERLGDAGVLLLFACLARGPWATAVYLGGLLALILGLGRLRGKGRTRGLADWRNLPVYLLLTGAAWVGPLLALDHILSLLGAATPLGRVMEAFARGTLLGGLSGLPQGVAVTGSAMILSLMNGGVPAPAAKLAVLVFRAGTSWFAAGLGLLALLRWLPGLRREAPLQIRERFDRLSPDYEAQIPDHIRERLIDRKIKAMTDQLGRTGPPGRAVGLDLGCGQGWYAIRMASLGYRVLGCDYSPEQAGRARANSLEKGFDLGILAASAGALPFRAASFDFVYGINVIHHLNDIGQRERAWAEIGRVLKPGGRFFLHEINVTNPLFRLYMVYLFPLLRDIDDGTERWVRPSALPRLRGGRWREEVRYFTFLPDFLPAGLVLLAAPLERWLERSRLKKWSAHFLATFIKD